MAISIALYEDNASLRDSLSGLLRGAEGIVLLAAFPDATKIEEQIKELTPDVILMDIDMPKVTGIEAVKKIRTFDYTVQIIMITVFDDSRHVLDSIIAGANGYLLKREISDRLMDAVQQVMNNEAPMSAGLAKMVIDYIHPKSSKTAGSNYGLSDREKEILASFSSGNSYKLIAAQYDISINTVRTHIKSIYEKLQVHSQTEAISKALREKIV
ncbi:MAG: response regulator transcription factor [Bacteroidetes bacterium]|nr:response regulator transcription factor [Bacteroidota bacterium]